MALTARNRAILICGASLGAGKTTLARTVSERLTRLGVANRWLSEIDLLEQDAFARFDEQLGHDDPLAIDSLGEAVHVLFGGQTEADPVLVVDALLPGFFWLLGRYPAGRVAAFRDGLETALAPLHPLVVYLGGDIAAQFQRAADERGDAWRDRMVAAISRWSVPHYPGAPVGDVETLGSFFAWLDAESRALLRDWPVETVVLDSVARSSRDLADEVTWRVTAK